MWHFNSARDFVKKFNFAFWRHSIVLTCKKTWTSPNENSVLWSTVCAIFAKTFDKASKCLQVPISKIQNEIESTKSKDTIFAPSSKNNNEHPIRQFGSSFRLGDKNSCIFSKRKVWTTRQSIPCCRSCQSRTSRNSPTVQEPILPWKQVWNNYVL